MSRNDQISVIVPTKDRPRELKRFLNSLDVQSLLPNELIIVDASENKKTFRLVNEKKYISKYKIKYFKSEPGLTRQKNIGVKKSKGKLLFFFDDDVVLDRKFIEVINDSFLEFNEFGVVGITGRITNTQISTNLIDKIYKRLFFLTEYGKGRLKLSGFPEHIFSRKISIVGVLPGGCTAYAKKIFSDYLFDERLKGYSYLEDVDFSYRVSRNYKLMYQPHAKLLHHATTYKTANTESLRKMLIRNHCYLFKKNIPKDFVRIYAFILSIIGLFFYNALFVRDFKACRGILKGLITPIRSD